MSNPTTIPVRAQSFALAATLLLSLEMSGCCFGGSAPTATDPFAIPAVAPAIPAPTGAAPTVAPAAMQAVTLGPGFAPDPTLVTTTAGGSVSASTLATPGVYCGGNVGLTPNVTLTTTAPITGLRVLARSAEDTTLIVRLSDGTVLCDDDGGGYPNPAVQGTFPPGVHQVYVGAFHTGQTPAATVAFTTNPALLNAALP